VTLGDLVELGAGVVAGGDPADSQTVREAAQLGELDQRVAQDAGRGGETLEIGLDERRNHALAEIVAVVDQVVADAQGGGHVAGVLVVAVGATGRLAVGRGRGRLLEQAHGDAHHLVPGLQEPVGRHGTVDAATHGDENLFFTHLLAVR